MIIAMALFGPLFPALAMPPITRRVVIAIHPLYVLKQKGVC